MSHFDHDLIPVKLDISEIHNALSLIESGVTQGQMGWISLGIEQIKAQIDRSVMLANRK